VAKQIPAQEEDDRIDRRHGPDRDAHRASSDWDADVLAAAAILSRRRVGEPVVQHRRVMPRRQLAQSTRASWRCRAYGLLRFRNRPASRGRPARSGTALVLPSFLRGTMPGPCARMCRRPICAPSVEGRESAPHSEGGAAAHIDARLRIGPASRSRTAFVYGDRSVCGFFLFSFFSQASGAEQAAD